MSRMGEEQKSNGQLGTLIVNARFGSSPAACRAARQA
jgi:hypothetical protein